MKPAPPVAQIERARAGDADALHDLLLRYQPDIARFARTVCATPEDAEDAVQETLWVAVQRIGTLRVASAFVGWLFQVVKHECYRLLRAGRRETRLDDLPLRTVNDASDDRALAFDVARAIAALPPPYRQVLIMRDIQRLSAPEVAAVLGITVVAVKSRLHRARAQVREALGNWDDLAD